MKLIMNRKMGFDKGQVVLVEGTDTHDRQLPAFKSQLQKLSGVKAVTISDFSIAYLGMNKWLQDYVYRIDIGIWMFAGAGGLVALIALATISAQALRAATANPVEALRMGE